MGSLGAAAATMMTLSACYGVAYGPSSSSRDAGPPSGNVHGIEVGAINQLTVSGASRQSAPSNGDLVYELADLPYSVSCSSLRPGVPVRTVTITVATEQYGALATGKYPITPDPVPSDAGSAADGGADAGTPAVRITAVVRAFDATCGKLLETSAVSGTVTFADSSLTIEGDYPSGSAPLIQETKLTFDDGSSLALTVAPDVTDCTVPAGQTLTCR